MNLMSVKINGDGNPDVTLTAQSRRTLANAVKVLKALGLYDCAAKEVALAVYSVAKRYEEAK